MKTILLRTLGVVVVVGGLAAAATINIDLAPGTGPAGFGGSAELTDTGAGEILVTLNVDSGDILGFFFNTQPDVAGPITSPDPIVTQVCDLGNANNLQDCGGGNNMNGSGAGFFEWGVQLGAQGGSDVGDTASFTLVGTGLDVSKFINQNVGVRVQSIPGNVTSAKIVGACGVETGGDLCSEGPPQEIPEPSSLMMLASGAGLLALAKFRK